MQPGRSSPGHRDTVELVVGRTVARDAVEESRGKRIKRESIGRCDIIWRRIPRPDRALGCGSAQPKVDAIDFMAIGGEAQPEKRGGGRSVDCACRAKQTAKRYPQKGTQENTRRLGVLRLHG